ncbi:MAG: phage holin family protein [Erythrobacter sp.]
MANPANDPSPARAPAADGTGGTTHRKDDENVVDLIGRLTSQSAHLAQQQVSLVQAEMRETADDIKKGVGSMLGAAVLGISGLGVTLMGIAYLIGDAIGDRDLATLLVGLAVLLIAAIMYFGAKSKLNTANAKPERTIETAERLPHAAQGETHTRTGA